MAALVVDPTFALGRFAAHAAAHLPRAARPVFVRVLETPDLTASFKYVTTRFIDVFGGVVNDSTFVDNRTDRFGAGISLCST